MTAWFKIWFVLTAFTPLYLILTLKFGLAGQDDWAAVTLGATLISFAVALHMSKNLEVGEAKPYRLHDVNAVDNEIFTYLMTYIPLFIDKDLSKLDSLAPLLVLYAMILILYIKLDSPYLHPIFAVLGIRVYEAKMTVGGDRIIVICRKEKLTARDDVLLHEIGTSDVYYCAN